MRAGVVPSPLPSPPGSAASPTAASSALEAPRPFAARTVSVNVSGDLLWHNSLWASAELDAGASASGRFDFVPQLASLTDYVSAADLAICHSEVPFAPAGGPYENYPTFAAPQEIAPAIRATGWDLCTTASNHTMDQGWEGLVRTIEVHRAAGILTAGSYASPLEASTPVIFTTASGVRVAVVSQTYGLNGLARPAGKPWSVDLLDAERAVAQARAAKAAGADLVAVHMHAGDEYSSAVTAQQAAYAEAVTAAPEVDLVFGQHAHVVQPVTKVNGKWVVYGAGNLIAASGPAQPHTYDGYVAQITFTEQEGGAFTATAAEYAPTMITAKSGSVPARVHLIPDELRKGTPLSSAMLESAARTRAVVHSLGEEGLTERQ
nr:CapA family protein [Tessaracoccus sp. MC1865]